MKSIFTIVKKEFARFFKDKRMLITVLLPGLLIYAMYSIMGAVFSDSGKADGYKYTAYVVNIPQNEELSAYFNSTIEVNGFDSVEDAQQAVSDGKLDLVIVFPENFDAALNEEVDSVPNVQIFYNSAEDSSLSGYMVVSSLLEGFKNPAFSINAGGSFDLVKERDSAGKLLSSLMPMLMFALLASGCVAVAPESIAGEKERGTMATMLITPIKRWQIAVGKIISLTCFALLSGISSFLGVILSLPKLMGGLLGSNTAAFYTAGDYFMIFGLIISVVLVIISAFSVLSALAKSVKEAGTMITPLMIVIILLGVASMFLSRNGAIGLYAIPLLGSGLAMSAIMSFTASPIGVVLSIISNLVVAAVLVVLLSFMFKSEKIMFNK
ncbi:MAG: ABC transporter permease subunit [Clostridia bacterium]|nr:ABC transporter permease subunit [Clostridia bacterium]